MGCLRMVDGWLGVRGWFGVCVLGVKCDYFKGLGEFSEGATWRRSDVASYRVRRLGGTLAPPD
jgi:hypothetical protein